VLAEDLAKPGAAARIAGALAERRLAIDVLVNNAGFGAQASTILLRIA
jgi:short-subunit dehydrogenase